MAIFYISPSGNDTAGSGSSNNPWLTLAKFLGSSVIGDTCICASGTYTWSTATLANRTIQAATGATVVFDAGGAAVRWTLTGSLTVTEITFQNAVGNTSDNFSVFLLNATGTHTFAKCRFQNIQASKLSGGLFGTQINSNIGGSVSLVFSLCAFVNISTVAADATTKSIFYHRTNYGGTMTITLTNCVLYFSSIVPSPLSEIFYLHTTDVSMVVSARNCIISNATGGTIDYKDGGSLTSALLASCFRNITGTPAGTGLITSDPLFVDAANGNFNLRPTSPCINSGILI